MRIHGGKQNQLQERLSSSLTRSSAKRVGASHTVRPTFNLQRTIGNQAVKRLLHANSQAFEKVSDKPAATRSPDDFSQRTVDSRSPAGCQAKLQVTTPGDIHEQQADRVAEQVLAAPAHSVINRQRMDIPSYVAQATGNEGNVPASVDRVLSSAGRPMEPTLRQHMEERFGHDFSHVRLHMGSDAAQSAGELNSNAYTVGQHIVLGAAAQLKPATPEAQHLIAHELVHVVQQRGGAQVLQRQPATGSKAQAQPDPIRALTPIGIKELDGLIKGGYFQEALNRLVGYKYFDGEIKLELLADKKMVYDPALTNDDARASVPSWDSSANKAEPTKVRVGPSAFSSVAYLYSVVMHEYQHVLWRQTFEHQQKSHEAHEKGFTAPDEVKASAWQLLHAVETGVALLPDRVAHIWENLNEAFLNLDSQEQANQRALVIQAFDKAKILVKGSKQTLVPFRQP